MSDIDRLHRQLCHDLLDAIEEGDLDAVARCYAPDMTMWNNLSATTATREGNLAVLAQGYEIQRRRMYNDRFVDTFDDGFLARYTCHVVLHDGSTVALSSCLVATVRDGKITHLADYMDSSKFRPRRTKKVEASS